MSAALATYLAGSASYALATVFRVPLRGRSAVIPAAALAPALAVAATGLGAEQTGWLLAAPAATTLVLLVARKTVLEVAVHLVFLRLCFEVVARSGEATQGSTGLLAVSLGATCAYSLGWTMAERAIEGKRIELLANLRMWLVAQAVLLSACGLIVLVAQELGWPAFAAVIVVLLLTRREFEAYARAETAHTQTLAALSDLKGANSGT